MPPQVLLLVNRLKTNIFRECALKIVLTRSIFSAQTALNIVWRPGSARTRWESLQSSPNFLAGFKGPTSKERRDEEREGRDEEGRKEWVKKGEYA